MSAAGGGGPDAARIELARGWAVQFNFWGDEHRLIMRGDGTSFGIPEDVLRSLIAARPAPPDGAALAEVDDIDFVEGILERARIAEECAEAAERALAGARAGKVHRTREREKHGVRLAIAYLHSRADDMIDPHAKAVLNGAACALGRDLADDIGCLDMRPDFAAQLGPSGAAESDRPLTGAADCRAASDSGAADGTDRDSKGSKLHSKGTDPSPGINRNTGRPCGHEYVRVTHGAWECALCGDKEFYSGGKASGAAGAGSQGGDCTGSTVREDRTVARRAAAPAVDGGGDGR